jgi:solute carrier family 25 (mitochondrial iron transporter), member 28/37
MDEDEYESLPPNASSTDHMVAGAAAGIMEHCIIYPVDVVKTRMMCLKPDPKARYSGIMDAFVKIVKNEGAFRPVRGMGVVAFGAGPAHALYFSCYEFIKNNFSGLDKPGNNSKTNLVAGCFATLLHDAVMVPSDVIKQRLQMYNSPYKGMIDCIVKTHRKEGIKAFYRSYFTQLSMNIPFQCTHLVTYDFLQSRLNPEREYHPLSHCISGAIAGAIAAAVTTPLDVCKTLLNTQECCNPEELCKTVNATSSSCSSNPSNKLNMNTIINSNTFIRSQSTATIKFATGLKDAATIIYRTEGAKGFFKGVVPRTVFQIPGTAVSWSVYEYFKYHLNKKHQHD